MVTHYFANFLTDVQEFESASDFWVSLWRRVVSESRGARVWTTPWLGSGSPELRDGNPIFDAWAPSQRRGLRIIQHPPFSTRCELEFWTDTFGGPPEDPDAIVELVIACALSDESERLAIELIETWLEGNQVELLPDRRNLGVPSIPRFAPPTLAPLAVLDAA